MALHGLKVIELAGLAPGPMCGMILADFGAKVIRVDKIGASAFEQDTLSRGKLSLAVDLKKPDGTAIVKKLCKTADVLIEPFRKGVMEKLGLGPAVIMKENPALIYSRLTGYGQHGPLSSRAGHDINYLAVSGVLSSLGRSYNKPHAPVNLLADFAGGGFVCALGILLALHERHSSGKGQVVDASMVEGVSYISSFLWTSKDTILFSESQGRGTNLLDGGAANYDTYETKDGKFMAVGALEPNFFNLFIQGMGLDSDALPDDPFHPQFVEILAQIFRTKTQQEWCDIFDEVDACVTPVVDLKEAHLYPQNAERASFHPSPVVPLPAPRLDRTPGQPKSFENIVMGQNTVEILLEVGFSQMEIEKLLESKVVEQNTTKSKL